MNRYRPIVIADQAIPFLEPLEDRAEIIRIPGTAIARTHLANASALLVRTRTRCDKALLEGTPVRFVGSATACRDHLATAELEGLGIAWAHAPGCNAPAVAQYVLAALAFLHQQHHLSLENLTVGIVGVGEVGGRLARALEAWGIRVLLCDPPRAAMEPAFPHAPLEQLLEESQVLTLHVPLTREGPHPTHRLLNDRNLPTLRPDAWLINSARGGIVDEGALGHLLEQRRIRGAILDCWEGEPDIHSSLLPLLALATPHIAGYSLEGKYRATGMVVPPLAKTLQLAPPDLPQPSSPEPLQAPDPPGFNLLEVLGVLTPLDLEDRNLRRTPERFEQLRIQHHLRRDLASFSAPRFSSPADARIWKVWQQVLR